jgi:alginate O-acetyltransferase complex protein AlgI
MTAIIIFALLLAASIIFYWSVPEKWRNKTLLIYSLIFIGYFNIYFLAYFVLNTVFVYHAALWIRNDSKISRRVLIVSLVWLIGNLFFFKLASVVSFRGAEIPGIFLNGLLPSILLPVGISYISFRLIHYIVESYRKTIPEVSLLDFASYILFFPTFLAGPVERIENFASQNAASARISVTEINLGLVRIVYGIIKKCFIADTLIRYTIPVLRSPLTHPHVTVLLAMYMLAIQIYMDFSGYTDIALGVARLFGYRIVENFRRPYLQKNIALFWRNWHISVYTWIRDYFFFPVFGFKTSPFKVYLGILGTMLVFNLWHGFTLNFLVLALYHTMGLSVWQIFQLIKKRYPHLMFIRDNKYLTYVCVAITFTFVSFGKVLFMMSVKQAYGVFLRLTFLT